MEVSTVLLSNYSIADLTGSPTQLKGNLFKNVFGQQRSFVRPLVLCILNQPSVEIK